MNDGHEIRPIPDSFYQEGKSLPADIMWPHHYPIEAVCAHKGCGERIRIDHYTAPWTHVPRGDLGDLITDWGDRYLITRDNGWWVAERRDNGAVVRCGSPDELDTALTQDDALNPVRLTDDE